MADPIIGQISVGDGATFTPAVDSDGIISWTNNKNLPNPASVDIPQAVVDRYQLAPTSNPTFTGTVTAEDITASGTITGNLVGDVSGNATSSTNATNDGNGNEISATYLPLAGGTLTGAVSGVTPATSDNSTKLATTEWGVNALKQYAFILDDSRTPTIPNNANLNNYTTPGTYRSTGSTVSTTLSNCPVSNSAFKLFVIEIGYGAFNSYGMQLILGIGRAIYVRNKISGGGWTAWGKLNYTDA